MRISFSYRKFRDISQKMTKSKGLKNESCKIKKIESARISIFWKRKDNDFKIKLKMCSYCVENTSGLNRINTEFFTGKYSILYSPYIAANWNPFTPGFQRVRQLYSAIFWGLYYKIIHTNVKWQFILSLRDPFNTYIPDQIKTEVIFFHFNLFQ